MSVTLTVDIWEGEVALRPQEGVTCTGAPPDMMLGAGYWVRLAVVSQSRRQQRPSQPMRGRIARASGHSTQAQRRPMPRG